MHRILRLVPFLLLQHPLFAQNPVTLELVPWATGAGDVVDITCPGMDDHRLFVVDRAGIIRIVSDSMTIVPRPFLDISAQVNSTGGEQGLLGLAFDPGYATNGRFYVDHITGAGSGSSVISRWTVSSDPDSADAMSEEVLFTWPQPYANHNGGDLAFGPDGMLYITFGDGGDAGDPQDHAQNLTDPLGDILRIDVSGASGYAVPPTNPYVDQGDTLPEIWASGFRNPFRFSFDRQTGDLWVGDVGQSSWEEVDHVAAGTPGGLNFGWRCYEGFAPFNTDGCASADAYTPPVAVHVNDGMLGQWCAVIGGCVYRGTAWPHLVGRYFYTDHCRSEFWSLRPNGGDWIDEEVLDPAEGGWTVLAEGPGAGLFVANDVPGDVYKLIDHCPMAAPVLTYTNGILTSTPTDLTYTWYLDGALVPGAEGHTYIPVQNGDYHAVGQFSNGCMLASDTLSITVTGIAALTRPTLSCSPDPADQWTVLSWSGPSTVEKIRVVDLLGRPVGATITTSGTRQMLDTSRFPAGNYILQLLTDDRMVRAVRRLTVVH